MEIRKKSINSDVDIILVDRSINDRQIWNYSHFIKGDMPKELYEESKEKFKNISKELIDCLIITYADPLVSLKRDYNCSLALERRSFLNLDNIDKFNKNLETLDSFFKTSVQTSLLLDTSNKSMNDVAIDVANKVLDSMRTKYIQNFKDIYEL